MARPAIPGASLTPLPSIPSPPFTNPSPELLASDHVVPSVGWEVQKLETVWVSLLSGMDPQGPHGRQVASWSPSPQWRSSPVRDPA